MSSRFRPHLATLCAAGLVALGAAAIAVVLTLNLHILLGVEGGYQAGPAEVLARSPALAVVDLILLVGLPVGAVSLMLRQRRKR